MCWPYYDDYILYFKIKGRQFVYVALTITMNPLVYISCVFAATSLAGKLSTVVSFNLLARVHTDL